MANKILKLGDVEYDIEKNPEIAALLETVRTEEKTKLYKTLEKVKADLAAAKAQQATTEAEIAVKAAKVADLESTLAATKAEATQKDTELKELQKIQEELKKSAGDESALEKKIREEFEKKLQEQEKKYQEMLGNQEKSLQTKLVSDYRKEILAQHKGKIVEDLLVGETIDELTKALPTVLEKSKKYILVEHDGKKVTLEEQEQLLKDKKAAAEAAAAAGNGSGSAPGAPGGGNGNQGADPASLIKDVKKLSAAEYAKNREALLMEATKLAQSS